MTALPFSHTMRLGAIVRRIEEAPDEMARWAIQRDLLVWLKEKARIDNPQPKPPLSVMR